MTKPEHFRKILPQKHCGNCKNLMLSFANRYKDESHICLKHNFTVREIFSTKMLQEYVCDDADPYEKEP